MVSGEAVRWLSPWLHGDALSAARHAQSSGSSNAWTIAAVLVAVAGSAIVAWQAWETHPTTGLGPKALGAPPSLPVDRARPPPAPDAPPIQMYIPTAGLVDVPGSQIEPGARWNLSEDAARLLQVQARIRVKNLMSDRTTHLEVTGLHDPAMHADTEVLLLPKTELFYFLTATFTLGQWAENWEAHQAGNPPPNVAEGCVIAGDDRDEGVVDRWPLSLAAWPIQPAGDSGETWQLTEGTTGKDWSDIAMRPLRERSYWISQRRGIPLPDLPERQAPAVRRAGKGNALCLPNALPLPAFYWSLPHYALLKRSLPCRLPQSGTPANAADGTVLTMAFSGRSGFGLPWRSRMSRWQRPP